VADGKFVPLLFSQVLDELFQFSRLNVPDMNKVSGEVHG
jgi:hypothetical protein